MGISCTTCGEPIFELIERKTTKKEIIEFVESSPLYSDADLHAQVDGSVLPGKYCPNGCTQAEEIGGGAICDVDFDEYEKALKRRTSKVILLAKSIDIEKYKIYLDGYIEGVGNKDKDSEGCILIWIEPGDHRIVVRENEVQKIESNTSHFTVDDSDEFKLLLSSNGDSLELLQC